MRNQDNLRWFTLLPSKKEEDGVSHILLGNGDLETLTWEFESHKYTQGENSVFDPTVSLEDLKTIYKNLGNFLSEIESILQSNK